MLTKEQIAMVCQNVNKAYCEALGDTSQPTWDDAPQWQKDSILMGVTLHINNPSAGTDDSHNAWLLQKANEGWKYGPVKNVELKEHPCFVSYEDLPKEQQAKDYIFRSIVHSLNSLASDKEDTLHNHLITLEERYKALEIKADVLEMISKPIKK